MALNQNLACVFLLKNKNNDVNRHNGVCDTAGRQIMFDIGDNTFMNTYGHSGKDIIARSKCENIGKI